jgi:ATP-dependent 26S proteasome regulatory subunit
MLGGNDAAGKRSVAAAACARVGVQLHVVRSADLPSGGAERAALSRLWHRESLLSNSALLVEHDAAAGAADAAVSFIGRTAGMVLIATREALALERSTIRLEVNKPSSVEQREIWQAALGTHSECLNGQLAGLTSTFDMAAAEIHAAAVQALARVGPEGMDSLNARLWAACRSQARRRVRELAQQIEPSARWPDLVLPDEQRQTLRDLVAHVAHRAKVYDEWGFASRGPRGLGITALFAGASGTGKTLAAEVIACELQLDLYRIDLSQVVSKYIGETEKNLSRVFDAAQDSGAVLLFDEADALFGKRSDVKDSHDRYANIEVSYLLQRMEAYRGLAILTTNMKGLIDTAFLRRLRFVVQFPFPDPAQRAAIWRSVFPAGVPTRDLQPAKLAQLNVSGGSIRNIALHASFYAAEMGEPVQMSHALRAAYAECAKLEKSISAQELRGWV